MRKLVVAIAALLSGCASHELGYAGTHPGAIECNGKASISITGAAALGPGGTETGNGSVIFDCGSGAYLKQGPPSVTNNVPSNVPTVPAAVTQ